MLENREIGKIHKGRGVVLHSFELGVPVRIEALVGRTLVDKRNGTRFRELHIYGAGGFIRTEYCTRDYTVMVEVSERPLSHLQAAGIVPNPVPFRYPPEF